MPNQRQHTANELKAQHEYIFIMGKLLEKYQEDFDDIEFYGEFTKALSSVFHKKETKTNTKLLNRDLDIICEFCGGCPDYAETKLVIKYGRANSYGRARFDLEIFCEIHDFFRDILTNDYDAVSSYPYNIG